MDPLPVKSRRLKVSPPSLVGTKSRPCHLVSESKIASFLKTTHLFSSIIIFIIFFFGGGFHKWGYPNRWFIMDKSMKMDDLGVPLFLEPPYGVQSNHVSRFG